MISSAWFTVLEYHIHLSGMMLGEFRDALEQIIVCLAKESKFPSNISKVEIKNAIKEYNYAIKDYKVTLTKRVPYRALSGFYHRFVEGGGTKINWNSVGKVVEYTNNVNKHVLLPYTFDDNKLLERKEIFNSVWM